jgi:hypothetical protein
MIHHNHLALDRTTELAEYDFAVNVHLRIACSAWFTLLSHGH